MTGTAVIALERFLPDARRIADTIGAVVIPYSSGAFLEAFAGYRRVVALMSAGIAVRGIAPLLVDKWRDPAVVVVSPNLRYAIPIVGGHHGGNDLARELSPLGIEPVITTATEVFGLESVEGLALRRGCDVVNRDSTRVVNAAILSADVPLYAIASPGIVVAGPGVSFLVKGGTTPSASGVGGASRRQRWSRRSGRRSVKQESPRVRSSSTQRPRRSAGRPDSSRRLRIWRVTLSSWMTKC